MMPRALCPQHGSWKAGVVSHRRYDLAALCDLFSGRQVFKIESDSGHEILLWLVWLRGDNLE